MRYIKNYENVGSQDPWHDIKVSMGSLMVDFYGFDYVDYMKDAILIVPSHPDKRKFEYSYINFYGNFFGNVIIDFDDIKFFEELISIITDWFEGVKWDILFSYVDKGKSWEIRFDGKKNSKKFITEISKLRNSDKFKEYIDGKKFGL
jgi:hypothetical protein